MYFYNGVDREKCAFHLGSLGINITRYQALDIFGNKYGLIVHEYDDIHSAVVNLSIDFVGKLRYKLGACPVKNNTKVDCSGLVVKIFSEFGILLPRYTFLQAKEGYVSSLDSLECGDLVFCTGRQNFFESKDSKGIGHVGIFVGNGFIVHAKPKQGVVKDTLEEFFKDSEFRGVQRILPPDNLWTISASAKRAAPCNYNEIRGMIMRYL